MTLERLRGFGTVIVFLVLSALLIGPGSALGAGLEGEWVGHVKSPDGQRFAINLTLTRGADGWNAQLVDETIGEVTLSDVTVVGNSVSFRYQPVGVPFPAHFLGMYDGEEDRLAGTFSIRGTSRFVKFQRVEAEPAPAPDAEPKEPARLRHDFILGASARVSQWAPLHVVKDEVYNLNTLTTGKSNYDLSAKVFVKDGFCVFGRMFRGGLGIEDDPVKLAKWPEMGISGNSYITLDGWEAGIIGYLGNVMMKNSNFNPYLTGAIGQTTWELNADGRGSDILVLERVPVEGTDLALAAGLGCEYEINQRIQLEFELLWRYFKTEDETMWDDPDNNWSNTHAWSFSFGATLGIF